MKPIIMLCGQAGVGKDTVAGILMVQAGFKSIGQADAIKELAKEFFGFTDEQLWGPSEKRNEVDSRWDVSDCQVADMFDDCIAGGWHATQLATAITNMSKGAEFGVVLGLVKSFYKQLRTFSELHHGLSARIVLQLLGTEVGRAADKLIWTRATFNKAEQLLDEGAAGVVVTDGRFRSEVLMALRAGAAVIRIDGDTSLTAATHASELELASIPENFFTYILENRKEAGMDVLRANVSAILRRMLPQRFYS